MTAADLERHDLERHDLDRYDDVRVSELLEASPEVLPLLLRHGFAPLRNAALRAALAPTVTLAQAVRLRGLSASATHALRRELVEVVPRTCSDDDAVEPVGVDACR